MIDVRLFGLKLELSSKCTHFYTSLPICLYILGIPLFFVVVRLSSNCDASSQKKIQKQIEEKIEFVSSSCVRLSAKQFCLFSCRFNVPVDAFVLVFRGNSNAAVFWPVGSCVLLITMSTAHKIDIFLPFPLDLHKRQLLRRTREGTNK